MIDTKVLRQAVLNYQSRAKPAHSGHQDVPVTMRDINKIITETVSVLNIFIDELEKDD